MRIAIFLLLLPCFVLGQCPDEDATGLPFFTADHCGNPQSYFIDCNGNTQSNFTTIVFQVDGSGPVTIDVASSMNYTFAPYGSLWPHLLILDACGGTILWGTFTCAPWDMTNWTTGIEQGSLAASYSVSLNMPPGIYTLAFGYLGLPQVQHLIEGCVTVELGTPFFLNNNPEDEEREKEKQVFQQVPEKIIHPLYGFCVKMPDGRLIDASFRQVE